MRASDFFFSASTAPGGPPPEQHAEQRAEQQHGLSQSQSGLAGDGRSAPPDTRGCLARDGESDRESDRGSDRCLVLGPSSSALSSVLLNAACRLAAAHPDRPVVFIARADALDAHPPLLPAGLPPSSPLLQRIFMRWVSMCSPHRS
ncbi:hypothetical protein CLOP_g24309 [Closterium sp. NIES-67]|nr:hypothetical protein CLOP_g24309 [Closterium sp. NIES-67]